MRSLMQFRWRLISRRDDFQVQNGRTHSPHSSVFRNRYSLYLEESSELQSWILNARYKKQMDGFSVKCTQRIHSLVYVLLKVSGHLSDGVMTATYELPSVSIVHLR